MNRKSRPQSVMPRVRTRHPDVVRRSSGPDLRGIHERRQTTPDRKLLRRVCLGRRDRRMRIGQPTGGWAIEPAAKRDTQSHFTADPSGHNRRPLRTLGHIRTDPSPDPAGRHSHAPSGRPGACRRWHRMPRVSGVGRTLPTLIPPLPAPPPATPPPRPDPNMFRRRPTWYGALDADQRTHSRYQG